MDANQILYIREQPIAVRYRGVVVGWHRPDFIVENSVVVEIKSVAHMRNTSICLLRTLDREPSKKKVSVFP